MTPLILMMSSVALVSSYQQNLGPSFPSRYGTHANTGSNWNSDYHHPQNQATQCHTDGFYLITRNWEPKCDAFYSTPEVVRSFETGYAPNVRDFEDFLDYVGAVLDFKQTFFYNIFASQTGAVQAQEAAQAFVSASILDRQIQPVKFTEGPLNFLYTKTYKCQNQDNRGGSLATRLWSIHPTSSVTPSVIIEQFQDGFAPFITTQPGFLLYGASNIAASEQAFFWNVFETNQEATQANLAAQAFVNNNTVLSGEIFLDVSNSGGTVIFDFGAKCNYQP